GMPSASFRRATAAVPPAGSRPGRRDGGRVGSWLITALGARSFVPTLPRRNAVCDAPRRPAGAAGRGGAAAPRPHPPAARGGEVETGGRAGGGPGGRARRAWRVFPPPCEGGLGE